MQKGNTLIFILIGILVITVTGGSYYLGTKKSSTLQDTVSRQNPVILPSTSPQPNNKSTLDIKPQNDETANWKTFTHSNNDFLFKYPDDVTLHELNDQYSDVSVGFKYPSSPDGCELCDGYLLSFKLGHLNQQSLKQISEKNLKDKEGYGTITQPLMPMSIADYSGFTFSYTVQVGTSNIYLSNGKGNYIEISKSVNDPQNRGYDKTINQILATFKFL